MLEFLRGKNFQNHSDIEVDLRHQITTITGPSDAGKSALLRMLKWVCCNVPQGDGFIKYGTDEAKVGLLFDGGTMVQRVRGKADNLYKLSSKEFRAFGGTVPDEIAAALNVGPINFQGQHDSVFWFSETAGEVSRRLNSVVDLGIIDTTFANIQSKVRSLQAVIQVHKTRLETRRAELKELDWVAEADRVLKGIEELAAVAAESALRATAARQLVESIKHTRAASTAAGVALASTRAVGLLGQEAGKAGDRAKQLAGFVQSIKGCKTVIDKGAPDLSGVVELVDSSEKLRAQSIVLWHVIREVKTAKDRLAVRPPDLSEISLFERYVAKLTERRCDLMLLVKGIKTSQESVEDRSSVYANSQKELEAASVGSCPVCGKEMKA